MAVSAHRAASIHGKGSGMTRQHPEADLLCRPTAVGLGMSDADAARLAGALAALSDPVRLRIYSIIAGQDETCSCNLEGPLGRSQPTISHHTNRLAAAGLIVGERRGRWTWWRAVPEQLDALRTALGSLAPGGG